MKSTNSDYINAYRRDKAEAEEYYLKHLAQKSGQQLLLESIISSNPPCLSTNIMDVGCGAGTLIFHVSKMYPAANFTLVDMNEEALSLANSVLSDLPNKTFSCSSIYDLSQFRNTQNIVFCWMTILCLDKPDAALYQLIDTLAPGGKLYISSLFNLQHDVDIYAHFLDHTRASAKEGKMMQYNTLSSKTISEWLSGRVESYKIHEFSPDFDLPLNSRGIGTYTVKDDAGRRLQISGGMLMNWGILEITK
jgi:ubiquinone/menaquinone biosynthesis C-methylase UbiE